MHLTLILVLLHAVGSHVGRHERRKPSVCVCSVMWVVAQVFMPAAPFAALCLLATPWTARAGGGVSVDGHLPDLHEPAVPRLGAHEEVRAAALWLTLSRYSRCMHAERLLKCRTKQSSRQTTLFCCVNQHPSKSQRT